MKDSLDDLFQSLINIRDSLSDDNPELYVYLSSNNNDELFFVKYPSPLPNSNIPYLLIKKDDNRTILSHGLDYLLESETLDKGSTLNKLFSRLEQDEKDILKMVEDRKNIIESIVRIAGKGPFKTSNNTIMIIEKNGRKFIRKIDKRAKEIGT